MSNRLAVVGDTLLNVHIGKDSITWGNTGYIGYEGKAKRIGRATYLWSYGEEKCLSFTENGFLKRRNESFVIPHAIGCQKPTDIHDYALVLQGSL